MRNYDRIGLRNSLQIQYPTFGLAGCVELYCPLSLLANTADPKNIVLLVSLLERGNVIRSGDPEDKRCHVEGV